MDNVYIDPHQITLLHSKHLKESKALPDISGAVVTISDLQAHARYKRQLRHALKELALEWEANKKIVDAAEWLMESGEELEDIKKLLDGLLTWGPI